jgi:hypothetical protein
MLKDEDFFDYGEGDTAVYNHKLEFKGATQINLEPVDELIGEIQKVKFSLPTKPSEMNGANIERYKTHVFDGSRLNKFEEQMKLVYSAFKTPSAYSYNNETMMEAIQSAFYDYEYDRDKEALIAGIDKVAAAWAADGFVRAPGSLGYDVSEMTNGFDRERTASTKGVFGDLANVVQQNIKWSIENGQSIESLHMDFAIKYSELSRVFIQSAVDSYVAEIEKRISDQQAQVMKIDSILKAVDLDAQADIKKNELELKERTARLAAYTQATNTFINTTAGSIIEELRLAANIAEGYGGIFASYGSLYTGISYEE